MRPLFSKIKNPFSFAISASLLLSIFVIQLNFFSIKESKNPYPISCDVREPKIDYQ